MYKKTIVLLNSLAVAALLIYSSFGDFKMNRFINEGQKKKMIVQEKNKIQCYAIKRLKTHTDMVETIHSKEVFRVQLSKKECLSNDVVTVYCLGNKCVTKAAHTTRLESNLKIIAAIITLILGLYYYFKT